MKQTALAVLSLPLLSLAAGCAIDLGDDADSLRINRQEVINGSVAAPDSAPWMAFLQLGSNQPASHLCGASLIDETHVLTAAHCVFYKSYIQHPGFDVVLGAERLSEVETSANVQQIPAKYVSVHPGFDPSTGAHDIAMIELESPAELNEHVATISLADWGDEPGTEARLNGWGKYDPDLYLKSDALLEGWMPIQSNATCDAVLQRPLDNSMLCAGMVPADAADRVVSCHGDSGGPLAVQRGGGAWDLVGIVSWGDPGVCGTYGAYSRVTSQRDWIDWAQAAQHRYLQCNNTSWNLSESNRLVETGRNGFALEFDVTTLSDSCTITYTNEKDGWGTKNGAFALTGNNWSPSSLFSDQVTFGEGTTQFSVQYPAAGRYRFEFSQPSVLGQQHQVRIVAVTE